MSEYNIIDLIVWHVQQSRKLDAQAVLDEFISQLTTQVRADERKKAAGLVWALTAIKASPKATNHTPGKFYEADAAQIAYEWAARLADDALATYNDNRKG